MPWEDGFRYRVYHERPADGDGQMSQRGGSTRVEIVDLDDPSIVLALGQALCRPDEQFNRKLGKTIALGRALKNLRLGVVPHASVSRDEVEINDGLGP